MKEARLKTVTSISLHLSFHSVHFILFFQLSLSLTTDGWAPCLHDNNGNCSSLRPIYRQDSNLYFTSEQSPLIHHCVRLIKLIEHEFVLRNKLQDTLRWMCRRTSNCLVFCCSQCWESGCDLNGSTRMPGWRCDSTVLFLLCFVGK